ncbi:jg5482 [Pararge aegeria aegeria]|uniref:Jg5482 protein n=1 Tax=Pararge aegeria aegeria TaxID=348720 RepID=A0A8S4SPB9_9NEOP|nr:jg5482 [Pararge aegeria aegeria]
MISSVFTLMALLSSCHTQDLIPNGNVSNNRLTENRLMQLPFQTSTEIIEESVSALTKAPRKTDQIADTLYTFPFLVNKSLLNYADILVSEYNTHVNDEDVTLSISELITKYGYPVERHAVRTEDGYNLQMFRIPNNGSVVFLMHGLGGCADDFILAGPQSGLAYLLSKEGYDVWMGNARGNKHSRSHQYLSPSDPNFWDFSWHEIGYYDLPAMIDYALGISKSETLKYIGYSQGSTVFFVMAAEKVQYNDKISIMVALSPIAYMTRVKSPLARLLSPGTPLMYEVSKSLGIYEFPMKSEWTGPLKLLMCGVGPLADILCSNVLFLAVGFDLEQLNMTNLPVILSHVPAGASVKQLVHYGQGVVSGEFRQFDLGAQGNLKRYGSLTPPKYDLDRVRVPVSLFYSNDDWMAHPDDVDQLYKELHNAVDIHRVPYEHFNHIDFIFAKEFKRLIHKRLRKLLSLF